tara:strand:+ start:54 stop:335 length:282 start_codon:yes stop_codon:yes gene_type:complete
MVRVESSLTLVPSAEAPAKKNVSAVSQLVSRPGLTMARKYASVVKANQEQGVTPQAISTSPCQLPDMRFSGEMMITSSTNYQSTLLKLLSELR